MAALENSPHAFDSNTNNNLNTHRASGMPEVLGQGGNLAVTSTNIEVYSNNMKVGFVQTFNPSENRTISKIRELGTEGVVQSVPSNTMGGQLAVSRFALYNSNLYNALGLTKTGQFVSRDSQETAGNSASSLLPTYNTYGNPFKTLKDQRVPLEFKVKTKSPNSTSYFIETYIDCWLSTYSKTIASNTITITESATIQYSDVISSFA